MPISVLAEKQAVLQYDQERAGLALRPYLHTGAGGLVNPGPAPDCTGGSHENDEPLYA
jgi:hypothetical protein